MKDGSFTFEEFYYDTLDEMSEDDFDQAMSDLVAKGLATETIVDGEVRYTLTSMGLTVGEHLTSDPAKQN
jgi:hypothetical protein